MRRTKLSKDTEIELANIRPICRFVYFVRVRLLIENQEYWSSQSVLATKEVRKYLEHIIVYRR